MDVLEGQAGRRDDHLEVNAAYVFGVGIPTGAVLFEEVVVEDGVGGGVLGMEDELGQPLQEGLVTTDADLQELIGDGDTIADDAVIFLGILETAAARPRGTG